MKIKRIVGMADNSTNNVIAELDNGFYAWVPTMDDDGVVEFDPKRNKNNYAYSYVIWSKWVPIIANGFVPPELFPIAMENFGKLFKEAPMDNDMKKDFSKMRRNPRWSEEEKEAEQYCNKEFDASGYDFMKDLKEIFGNGPVDPVEGQ